MQAMNCYKLYAPILLLIEFKAAIYGEGWVIAATNNAEC